MEQSHAATIDVTDDVGLRDRLNRLHGGQSWVPGSDAHELDLAYASTHGVRQVRAFGKPRSPSAPTARRPPLDDPARPAGGALRMRARGLVRARAADRGCRARSSPRPPRPRPSAAFHRQALARAPSPPTAPP